MAVAFDVQAPAERPVRMLYSFVEAASWLKVSPRQVRILVDEKQLRSVHIGRLHRIAHADLVAYVDALRSRD
jgi:excisionase family DNA binding protein